MALDANPRTRPGSLLLGIGLLVAVAVIGYLLGMVRNRAEPTIARESTIEVRADTRELDALHTELRELRDELSRPRTEHESRAPALPRDDTNARLVAVLERLEAAIGRIEAGQVKPASMARDTGSSRGTELISRLEREVTALNPETLDDGTNALYLWFEQRSNELTTHHLLWTLDDVIAAYGRPTKVESSADSITLYYDVAKLASEDRRVRLYFSTSSLRVVHVSVTD